jgi:hypothetical protein
VRLTLGDLTYEVSHVQAAIIEEIAKLHELALQENFELAIIGHSREVLVDLRVRRSRIQLPGTEKLRRVP